MKRIVSILSTLMVGVLLVFALPAQADQPGVPAANPNSAGQVIVIADLSASGSPLTESQVTNPSTSPIPVTTSTTSPFQDSKRDDVLTDLGGSDGDPQQQLVDAKGAGWTRESPNVEVFSYTFTPDTSAYTSGFAFGPKAEITNFARATGEGGIIHTTVTIDTEGKSPEMDIFLFEVDFTGQSDNTAFNVSDSEMLTSIGTISITTANWKPGALNSVATVPNQGHTFQVTGTSLFVQAVIRATPTYAGGQTFKIRFKVIQE
ncbi:hypothetical protein LCGC14_0441380 [marine sediment metagenome]|uniref:Uncharacterized protein n=1 Tax=marine sediment metagenome TaxID=412755 RepID=A0A0F9V7C3_9ZZZZ